MPQPPLLVLSLKGQSDTDAAKAIQVLRANRAINLLQGHDKSGGSTPLIPH